MYRAIELHDDQELEPEVLDVVDLPDPVPRDGEVLYDISSSGMNFADTHHRQGTRYTNLAAADRASSPTDYLS